MAETINGITVDFNRDKLFDKLGLIRLKESYMKAEENSFGSKLVINVRWWCRYWY